MLNQDTIREATRLTHAGQLADATALLQRMLRGERAPAVGGPLLHGEQLALGGAGGGDTGAGAHRYPLGPVAPGGCSMARRRIWSS